MVSFPRFLENLQDPSLYWLNFYSSLQSLSQSRLPGLRVTVFSPELKRPSKCISLHLQEFSILTSVRIIVDFNIPRDVPTEPYEPTEWEAKYFFIVLNSMRSVPDVSWIASIICLPLWTNCPFFNLFALQFQFQICMNFVCLVQIPSNFDLATLPLYSRTCDHICWLFLDSDWLGSCCRT